MPGPTRAQSLPDAYPTRGSFSESRKSDGTGFGSLVDENYTTPYNPYHGTIDSQADESASAATNESEHYMDAYARRNLQEQQEQALTYWEKRVKWTSCVCFVVSAAMMVSRYWYANFLGCAMGALGFYGSYKRKTEYVFVALILVVLEFIKNIGVIVLIFEHDNEEFEDIGYPIFLLICMFIDSVLVCPYAGYCFLYLYRTLCTNNTGLTFGYNSMDKGRSAPRSVIKSWISHYTSTGGTSNTSGGTDR